MNDYPFQYIEDTRLPGGEAIRLRPVLPEDAEKLQDFVRHLSEESRYYRYMGHIKELSPKMLEQFSDMDFQKDMALVAVPAQGDGEEILGVGRYMLNPDGQTGDFALVVADEWRCHGVGETIARRLIEIARERGLRAIYTDILAANHPMLRLVAKLGFTVIPTHFEPVRRAVLPLPATGREDSTKS